MQIKTLPEFEVEFLPDILPVEGGFKVYGVLSGVGEFYLALEPILECEGGIDVGYLEIFGKVRRVFGFYFPALWRVFATASAKEDPFSYDADSARVAAANATQAVRINKSFSYFPSLKILFIR